MWDTSQVDIYSGKHNTPVEKAIVDGEETAH